LIYHNNFSGEAYYQRNIRSL